MARSIEYWYNLLVTEKQTFSELDGQLPLYDLTEPDTDNPFLELLNEIVEGSKLAVWKCWLYILAVGYYTLDTYWDETKTEMEEIAAASIVANQPWYADQVKKWQYGDALIFNGNTYRYYYADTTSAAAVAKRLVTRVAVVEKTIDFRTTVVIKVTGATGPLDSTPGTEEDSLYHYITEIKPAGVDHKLVNLESDKVRLHLKIYYDGTLVLADFQEEVEAAIQAFLEGIYFNGILHIKKLEDALQLVTGTKEPWCYVLSCECKADTDAVYTPVVESYDPVSGWFELVPVGNTVGVDTVIEYTPV